MIPNWQGRRCFPFGRSDRITNKKNNYLGKREKRFCAYYQQCRNAEAAAEKAGYPAEECAAMGAKLMLNRKVQKEIRRLDEALYGEQLRGDIITALRRLAFGAADDSLRRVLDGKEQDAGDLDLFAVKELRKLHNGSVEIKLFDRIQAMRLLYELSCEGGQGDMEELLDMLE